MRLGHKKAGVSPVLATVLLIAVTLIASLMTSGFVFGIMGTFTSVALVSVSGEGLCSGTPEACTLTLTNTGTSNTNLATSCRMSFGGSSYPGTVSLVSGSLNAGSRAVVLCSSGTAGSHAMPGSSVTGWLTIGWDLNLLFVATAN